MNVAGQTGYLIQKTVQKNSLRGGKKTCDKFRGKNILAYIKKKAQSLRLRDDLVRPADEQLVKDIDAIMYNDEQNSRIRKVNVKKELRELWKEMEWERDDEYYDDHCLQKEAIHDISKEETQEISKNQKQGTIQELKDIMNQVIDPKDVRELFYEYRLAKLKHRIKDFQENVNALSELQKTNLIAEDEEENRDEAYHFIAKITQVSPQRPRGFTIGSVLNIENSKIYYKSEEIERDERNRRIEKKQAMQQFDQLAEVEERMQKKEIINIFNVISMNNESSDNSKNKFNGLNLKKKQEILESLYVEMVKKQKILYLNAHKDQSVPDQSRFIRKKWSKKVAPVSSKRSKPASAVVNSIERKFREIQSDKSLIIDKPHNKKEEETGYQFVNRNLKRNQQNASMNTFKNVKYNSHIKQIHNNKSISSYLDRFLEDCSQIKQDNLKMQNKLHYMHAFIAGKVQDVQDLDFEKSRNPQQTESYVINKSFREYIRLKKFQHLLISYLVDRVEEQRDLLSKYKNMQEALKISADF